MTSRPTSRYHGRAEVSALSVRFSEAERDGIRRQAATRGLSESELVRMAVAVFFAAVPGVASDARMPRGTSEAISGERPTESGSAIIGNT
jgi:hypothetical protein